VVFSVQLLLYLFFRCTDSDSNDSRGNNGVTNGKPDVSVTVVKFEATTYLDTDRKLMFDLKKPKNVLHFSECAHLLEITM
jgi:hypothetical protein